MPAPPNPAPDSFNRVVTPRRAPHQRPSIHLNWEDWLPYLEESDASEAEKEQTIEVVWAIVLAFVDLGWDVADPQESCGQSLDLTAALRAAVLNSECIEKEEV